jgi:DNA (cytosine-5)-methyltransferase 1
MSNFKVVSLYTGAGGLDYGFETAGFETAVAVEIDSDCCATIRANRPWAVIERDIHRTPSREILDTAGLRTSEVDLLLGGPPCQPFSKSGYWVDGDTRRLDDPRADTLSAYMRCVADLLPKVFVLENVHGISYSGKEEGFRLLEAV